MNLTSEERVKFAQYLNEVSTVDDKLAEDCNRAGQIGLAKRLKNEAAAARIVAGRLLSIQEES